MKKLQVGLVVEGNSTSSTLLRLSGLASELGPVKSLGLQSARRVSNFLNGGYAVTAYTDLAVARTILIRVPDTTVQQIVAEIYAAGMEWQEHSFILCESWTPTQVLEPLQQQGASIASIVSLPTGQDKIFVIEGDVPAVRQVRRLIERAGARTLELRAGSKHLLFAAAILCTAIPVPVLLMAQQALRDSGVTGNQLSAVIQEMSGEMLQRLQKGARTTWGGPLAESSASSQKLYWEKLEDSHPDLCTSLKSLVTLGREYMVHR